MSKGFMRSTVTKSSEGILTNAEKYNRKIARLDAQIADARRVLDWQISEGYETQAAISRSLIARLEAMRAKVV